MNNRIIVPLLLIAGAFLLTPTPLVAQWSRISARYNDSFREWTLFYGPDEEELGELRLRWILQDNWLEWEFSIGEVSGTIQPKWRQNPWEWELRADNRIFTARPVSPNDPRQWRITDNQTQITWQTRYGNTAEEWQLRDSGAGTFSLEAEYPGDPRDWVITDDLDIHPLFKMMMTFLTVYYSSPKQ